ncbi:MAG TPA: HepT-like ribonuclease domain-containing protein [Hanamia sp.]|nr:HepT-like ribonuclease domain-containing protein [Hanamia sp.]
MWLSNLELLKHVKDEIDFVLNSVGDKKKDSVINDDLLSRAIIRSLEIIGEATKKLDDDFKRQYPHIEWKKMAATRDKLIHDYFGVDYDIVWDIIENKLPDLQFFIGEVFDENKD